MLPAVSRLQNKKDILATIKAGKRIHTPYITAYIQESKRDNARIACIVGKKVSKLATRRHAIQRKLRAMSADVITRSPRGYDMVLVARPEISGVKSQKEIADQTLPIINEHLKKYS